MKSYLLSSLKTRFAARDVKDFESAYPHDWLLWEPGAWHPPAKSPGTLVISRNELSAPRGSEALALALVPGKPDQAQLTLGRSESCDLYINDGTLSSTHLIFMRGPAGWTIRDAGSRNGTWLDGMGLTAGVPAILRPGGRVQAADVNLTFYTSAALWERLGG